MLGLALKMRGRGAAIVLIAISVLYLASQSSVFSAAGINQTINFQGKVVNSDGTNVTNGNYDFVFRLYKASSGGVAQWTETWNSGTSQVTVTDGIFRVALGTHQSMSSLDFNDDSWYLTIEFNGDGEMDPRIRFAAVPYAFNAKTVGGLTVTNTTGTLTVPNGEVIQFGGSFTTGAQDLTLNLSGTTTLTLPTTGTLATLAGNEILTNKTIGSTGLTFSGASLDVTTATDEDLTITPNGDGDAVFNLASTGDFLVQDATTNFVQFLDDGTITLGKGSGAGSINIGTGTAADTLSIGSDNTAGDIITIGNNNASTTLALTGGDDWSISSAGNAIFAGTTGVSLTGTGSDLIFANSERITNDTNGAFTFARNDAGTVTLNAADDDSTAALTVTSGGAAALTLDTGGAAALNLGNTNATSLTMGNSNVTVVDLIAGTATVNIADNATTKTIDLGGVTNSGTDTINIATNATAADAISIGNTHSSTTLVLTGGDDWLVTATGSAHMNAWEGGGLYDDCNSTLSKIVWDSETKTFACASDVLGTASTPDTGTFVDTTAVAFADNNTTELFNDTPRPNITTDSTTAPVLVAVQIRGNVSNTTADAFLVARVVYTTDGSAPSCSTSTQAGQEMIGGFTTNTTHPWQVVGTFIHTPGVAGLIRYTVCTSSLSVGTATDTPEAVQVSLSEFGNANSNWTMENAVYKQNASTADVLLGGVTTSSAKIAFIGMNSTNTPVASISATGGSDVGKGTVISGNGSVQGLRNEDFIVGGNTTGNIVLSPNNSVAGAKVRPGADDTVDLGSSTSARFRNLFLGPDSLHLQCLTADGCGQNLDYSISVNTATNALYISSNGRSGALNQLLTINEGGRVDIASNLQIGGTSGISFTTTGGINLAGGVITDSTDGVDINDDLDLTGSISLTGGTISDATDGVDINDDLDITGGINLTTGNVAFSSTGSITFTGGAISDVTDEVDINDDLAISGTTGLIFTGSGADITFTNLEFVSNDSNGTITLGTNTAGGGVILNAADTDATSALTINSGGASTLTIDTGGGATLNIGNTNANALVIGNETGSTSVEIDSGTGAINIGNAVAKTITIGNSASTTSITLSKGSSGNFVLQSGGAALDCSGNLNSGALSTNSSGQIICTDDDGGAGGATAWNAIGDASVNGAIALAQTTQTMDWTMSTNAVLDGLTFTLNNGLGTDSNTQRLIVIANANDGGSTGTTEALLVLDNLDANEAVTSGLIITSSGGAATSITRGLDFDDSDIVTDIEFQNNETLSNDADDEITFSGAGGSNNTGLIIDLDGATNAVPTLRATVNDLINIFDGLSIGIDGATTENISLTGFAISGGNDLYIDDQLGVNGNIYIDGTIDTVGGLTFNGTATDITTATNEDLAFTPNGTGNLILNSDFNTGVRVGSSTNTPAVLSVSGGIGNNAAFVVNNTNSGDILAASASGTTRFAVENDGTVQLDTTKYANCDGLNADSAGNLQCGAIMIRKSATENVQNSTALQDDNELLFSIGANETWIVQVNYIYTTNGNATPDIRVGFNNTAAGATCDYSVVDISHAGNMLSGESTACNTAIVVATTQTGEKGGIATGTFTGTGAGTVAFRWAQGTADNTNVTQMQIGASLQAWKINGADLAEVYYSKEGILAPGTVLTLDSSLDAGVQTSKKAYEKGLVGVVTTNPSIVMGDPNSSTHGTPIIVALSGRVPVKVSTENGPILPGDMLTSSSTPGVAMKATKAGVVIGQAMTGYEGGGVGEVTLFVKNTQFMGSISSALQNNSRGQVLAGLVNSIAVEEPTEISLSEINTDLVIAGREIITPTVSAEDIFTTTIRAVEGDGLIVKFDDDGGGVSFVNSDTNVAVISFDKNGNAYFAGTITAGKVRASEIEGMEIMAGSISQLEGSIASLSGMVASGGASLHVDNSLNLTSYQSLDLLGGLIVGQTAVLKGESIFERLATFVGKAVFKNKVTFEKTPEFSRDTAGFAVIKAGDRRVHIVFENQYYYTPVITANIVLNEELNSDGTQKDRSELERSIFDDDYQLLISNRSAKGFDIVLNTEARTDIPVSWTAFASFNANTIQTEGIAGFSATPTPQVTSLIPAQESGSDTSDPDESPSPAPSPASQGTPTTSEQEQIPVLVSPSPTGSGEEEGGDNL